MEDKEEDTWIGKRYGKIAEFLHGNYKCGVFHAQTKVSRRAFDEYKREVYEE